MHISGCIEYGSRVAKRHVVAHDAGLPRIPGEWSDHGTNHYKPPPGAYGWLEFSLHGYIGRLLSRNGRYIHAGGPH